VAVARARADVLAEATGLEIVGVADVVEGSPAGAPVLRMKAERMTMAADPATPIEAGTTEVVVHVTVTYRTR
jgi:uncharacterized protein YggE